MMYHHPIHQQKTAQHGITLIEALIALLILALGVLGLAAVQARMLVETRTTNARATAIRLIADLGERIRANAAGLAATTAPGTISPYVDGPAGAFAAPVTVTPPAVPAGICNPNSANPAQACSPQQQAAYDVWAWRTEVANTLMNGRASISQVSPQQLQIIIAWQANENSNITLTKNTAADQQLSDYLQITSSADKTTNLCPAGEICHIDFIDIPPS